MEQDQNDNKVPKTYCQNCKKYILTQNYLIHEGRCQMSSHLKSSLLSQKKQQNQKKRQIDQTKSTYSIKNLPKQRISPNMKKNNIKQSVNQRQQLIPCYFCGYRQKLTQLDEHPKKCQHWQIQCELCKSKFPKSLIKDHQNVCQKNPSNIQRSQRNYQRSRMGTNDRYQDLFNYQQDQQNYIPMIGQRRHQNLYQPSPLMNLFAPRQRQRRPVHQSQINFNSYQRDHNQGPPIFFRSNSSNPNVFIQLIQMLANRTNPNRNPGLKPQQLAKLKKIKYQKKGQDNDLCTICYCQFQLNQQIIELNCKHIFHQQCIFEWLKRVSNCPICKKNLKPNINPQPNRNSNEQSENQFQQLFNMMHGNLRL